LSGCVGACGQFACRRGLPRTTNNGDALRLIEGASNIRETPTASFRCASVRSCDSSSDTSLRPACRPDDVRDINCRPRLLAHFRAVCITRYCTYREASIGMLENRTQRHT